MKVLLKLASNSSSPYPTMISKILLFFQFSKMTWTFFFIFLVFLSHLSSSAERRRRLLIQFNATIKPFVTTVYDIPMHNTTQTRNYIMEKSILLRKQWLIRSHGKWIWRWKIFTRTTLHRTFVRVKMRWESRKLVCDYKVSGSYIRLRCWWWCNFCFWDESCSFLFVGEDLSSRKVESFRGRKFIFFLLL